MKNKKAAIEDLAYDPDTGLFTWVNTVANKQAGSQAGSVQQRGYVVIRLSGKTTYAHRLAWELSYGPVRDGMVIDHINGNKTDNRICNLREVTQSQNLYNRRKARGESGVVGAIKCRGKWRAQLVVDGKPKHLGTFDTPEEAAAAYRTAKHERGIL